MRAKYTKPAPKSLQELKAQIQAAWEDPFSGMDEFEDPLWWLESSNPNQNGDFD